MVYPHPFVEAIAGCQFDLLPRCRQLAGDFLLSDVDSLMCMTTMKLSTNQILNTIRLYRTIDLNMMNLLMRS